MQGMPHPWEARLQHDRLGRETLHTMTGGVACAMQYDGVGRPSRQSETRGGHSLYNRSYRWDDDFLLSHTHDAISGRIVRYFYDDFGSLAEAEYGEGARQWRNPDVMGNVYDSTDRTDRTYARGGQLREDRRWRYHYDKQGNLVLKTKRRIRADFGHGTPQTKDKGFFGLFSNNNTSKERREREELIAWQPGDYAYTWLPNGMLGSVTRPDGKTVTFKYDALGRRVEKTFNGRVHRYLWDGDVVLHEWEYDETERPQQIVAENGEVSFDRSRTNGQPRHLGLRHRQLCSNRQVGGRQALRHRERLHRPPRAGLRRTRNARLASRLRHLWQLAQPQGRQTIRAI